MRRLMGLALMLGFTAAAACAPATPPPPPGPTPAEMVSAANALDQQFVEAFNKGDADAMMATYWNSPNLVSFNPEGGGQGFDAAKAGIAGMLAAMAGAKLELYDIHNDVHGDVVLGWGRWRLTMPAAKGPAQTMEGRYTDLKAQKDGRWVYVMDHASVPVPPQPDPAKK